MNAIERLYQIREESNERYGVYRGDLVAEARAERLDHSKTCDAHYLALAGEMGVEFWTADERLVKGARQAGAGWVRWVMEPV